MLRYGRGDVASFDLLYARHKDAVYRYCLRQLPRGLADDAHQEVWLALIKARQGYDARGQFKAWLFTLAHNVVVNRVRAELKHPKGESNVEMSTEQAAPDTLSEKQRLSSRLMNCIHKLPHHQRDALVLRHEAGFSIGDIAAITATSHEGVKSRLRYAKDKLREQLARNGPP